MSDQELLEKDISELIGINDAPAAERDDMLVRIGELILEAVILRVIADLSEENTAALEAYLQTDPEPEALLLKLEEFSPNIDTLFGEEVLAFKRECVAVMERQRGTLKV